MYELFERRPATCFALTLSGSTGWVRIQTTRFDREHGSVYDGWLAMGAPAHLQRSDLEVLKRKMEPDVSVQRVLLQDAPLEWTCSVEPHGVTSIDITVEPLQVESRHRDEPTDI